MAQFISQYTFRFHGLNCFPQTGQIFIFSVPIGLLLYNASSFTDCIILAFMLRTPFLENFRYRPIFWNTFQWLFMFQDMSVNFYNLHVPNVFCLNWLLHMVFLILFEDFNNSFRMFQNSRQLGSVPLLLALSSHPEQLVPHISA